MDFIKVCMNCGNEFEDSELFDATLTCPRCASGDIHHAMETDYQDATLEECFITYIKKKIACIFDADTKEIIFMEE